ncbi:MAG: glycosyltransferase family 4 protein [Rhodoferax sp.]|nr:glycosyltransferase family 4 protein [Rhodoferax sp.]
MAGWRNQRSHKPDPHGVMRRLLLDVTRTLQSEQHTGIQRVVRRLWHALHATSTKNRDCAVDAVMFEGTRWHKLTQMPRHALESDTPDTPDTHNPSQASAEPIQPGPGDTLLLADASWYLDPWPAVDAALDNGAVLAGFVHDLLPLQQPQWFKPELPTRFAAHLQQLTARASLLLTPSHVVRAALQGHSTRAPVVRLALGADFLPAHALPQIPALPLPALMVNPFVLMVGTIEPRKNHQLVLAAFEQLWEQGSPLQLVLVGASGWCSDALLQRIETHAEKGKRLHRFTHLPDVQLHTLYKNAQALAFASLNEGFGLPLAEAAYLGCPVLAADIPVLREVGGDWPSYLPVDNTAPWVVALTALQNIRPASATPTPARTWDQVADELWKALTLETSNTKKINRTNQRI